MKRKIIFAICFLTFLSSYSQKMMTRTGEVKFEATITAFEEIAATNSTVSCIFDKSNGEIAALVLIKAFKFKSPLMEEHFNENYLESSKFPKSNFKGKVLNFDASKANATYDVEGDLTIHGVTKKVKTKANFTNSGKSVAINFSIKPKDYNIKIPSVVKNKIAENVKILIKFELENK